MQPQSSTASNLDKELKLAAQAFTEAQKHAKERKERERRRGEQLSRRG